MESSTAEADSPMIIGETPAAPTQTVASSHPDHPDTGDLLSIEPHELKFPFELKKQVSCSLQLSNKTDHYVAFKVKTTNPKKYCVRPNTGVILPRSTCDVIVTMQAQREAPPDLQCKDKFLLQSVKTYDGATAKDIAPETFNKDSGYAVEETRLRVLYVSPQSHSPSLESADEGGFMSDSGYIHSAEGTPKKAKSSADRFENLEKSSEDLMKREGSKSRGGISFKSILVIALVGIIIGYIMK